MCEVGVIVLYGTGGWRRVLARESGGVEWKYQKKQKTEERQTLYYMCKYTRITDSWALGEGLHGVY